MRQCLVLAVTASLLATCWAAAVLTQPLGDTKTDAEHINIDEDTPTASVHREDITLPHPFKIKSLKDFLALYDDMNGGEYPAYYDDYDYDFENDYYYYDDYYSSQEDDMDNANETRGEYSGGGDESESGVPSRKDVVTKATGDEDNTLTTTAPKTAEGKNKSRLKP